MNKKILDMLKKDPLTRGELLNILLKKEVKDEKLKKSNNLDVSLSRLRKLKKIKQLDDGRYALIDYKPFEEEVKKVIDKEISLYDAILTKDGSESIICTGRWTKKDIEKIRRNVAKTLRKSEDDPEFKKIFDENIYDILDEYLNEDYIDEIHDEQRVSD